MFRKDAAGHVITPCGNRAKHSIPWCGTISSCQVIKFRHSKAQQGIARTLTLCQLLVTYLDSGQLDDLSRPSLQQHTHHPCTYSATHLHYIVNRNVYISHACHAGSPSTKYIHTPVASLLGAVLRMVAGNRKPHWPCTSVSCHEMVCVSCHEMDCAC